MKRVSDVESFSVRKFIARLPLCTNSNHNHMVRILFVLRPAENIQIYDAIIITTQNKTEKQR